MLLTRSIFLQLLLALAGGQRSEYDVEDHYEDEYKHPDYSKLYSFESPSAALSAQANEKSEHYFFSPTNFDSFLASFGSKDDVIKPQASSKNAAQTGFSEYDLSGFGVQDYFDKVQDADQSGKAADNSKVAYEPKPGPSYVSHRVPAKSAKIENFKDDEEQEKPRYESYKSKNKGKKVPPISYRQANSEVKVSPYGSEPSKYVNLYSGKSYPTSTQSPYQKYSFQPTTDSYGSKADYFAPSSTPYNPTYSKIVASTAAPYKYQPSEYKKGHECKKIRKSVPEKDSKTGRFKRQPMNCFVCKDPKSGSNYEQCSYSSESKPKSYHYGNAKKYTETSDRPKRYLEDHFKQASEDRGYVDPYEKVKAATQQFRSRPEEFDSDYYKPSYKDSDFEQYRVPKFNEDEEKSYSETQSEKLVKNGDKCEKVVKDGMTCVSCVNSKGGGNYEQCSYSSEPKEHKYAYVRESKFDGTGNPTDKLVEGSEPQEVRKKLDEQNKRDIPRGSKKYTNSEAEDFNSNPTKTKESYSIPKHFAENTQRRERQGVRGLDPELYGGKEKTTAPSKASTRSPSEEYHSKYFPKKEASEKQEVRSSPDSNSERFKDVTEVLAEFNKKDRSHCKKEVKDDMTCYLCVDKSGSQHEECMFVSESQPKTTHLAYHELKQSPTEKATESTTAGGIKRKRVFKKAVTPRSSRGADHKGEASEQVETRIKYGDKEPVVAESRVKRKEAKKKSKKPKEIDVHDEEGAYSHLTKPVFSKALGYSLPAYMLEKSEHEAIFDEFEKSG